MSAPINGCVREATLVYVRRDADRQRITDSADAHSFLRALIGSRICESFIVIALDAKQRPVAWSEIARGTISSCQVGIADVLRFALLSGAPAVLVSHNHPSGEARPSAEDIALTQRLADGARLIGIALIDHVIVTDSTSFSFVDAGVMPLGAQP